MIIFGAVSMSALFTICMLKLMQYARCYYAGAIQNALLFLQVALEKCSVRMWNFPYAIQMNDSEIKIVGKSLGTKSLGNRY